MSAAFTNGIPGLEAYRVWTTGHRSGLTATLNDWAATGWRVILEDITGEHGSADAEDSRSKKLGRIGENRGPVYLGGRTLAYTGRIEATTVLNLRAAELALEAAFEERDLPGTMRLYWAWEAIGPTPGPEGPGPHWYLTGRVIDYQPDEQQTTGNDAIWPYQRAFTLGIRCDDPRRYWHEAITGGPNSTSVTVSNPGIDADPIITVETAGGGNVNITNTTLGVNLKWDGSLFGSSVVTFDFARRLIWVNDPGDTPFEDGDAYTELLLTAQSTWWNPGVHGIDRGSNTITLTGGTSIAVEFQPGL